MTIPRIIFLSLLLCVIGCSSDDEPKSKKPAFGFSSDKPILTVPSKMQNSQNEQALTVASYMQMVNGLVAYTSFMQPPSGATKSSTPIVAENARVASIQTTYEVYEWVYEGGSVAYQWSEQAGMYVFEVFLKFDGEGYQKYIVAKQTKDGSAGSMDVYSDNEIIFQWKWIKQGNTLTFEYFTDDFKLILVADTKTNAGDVKYYLDGKLFHEYEWDSNGNGSYKSYDDEGDVVDEGEWTV